MIGYIIAALAGFFCGLIVMAAVKNRQYEDVVRRQNQAICTLKEQIELYRRGYKDE